MEEMLPPENRMGTAKISGLVLKTGLPLMISLLINSLYNFVDSVFVARISEEALTALSLAAPVQIIMSAMGLGIAVGLNAVISRAVRREEQGQSRENGICRAGIGISGMGTGCHAGTNCNETIFQMAVRRSRSHYGLWNPIPADLYAGFPGYDGTMGI